VLTLVLIGVLSGIVTGLSPCVLPVLPAVLATASVPAGIVDPAAAPLQPAPVDRSRPFLVIAGLVSSFAVFTLLGSRLLAAAGLPPDTLRVIGIVSMLLVGLGLLVPGIGHALERPFARLGGRGPVRGGSAFLFGATFGLAFVPCAGPVLAAITVLAATSQVGGGLIALTVAFSVGVAMPLLAFALAGQGMTTRIRAVRSRLPLVRQITGGVLVLTALGIWFGLADQVQRLVPGYVASVQSQIEDNATARQALSGLSGQDTPATGNAGAMSFDECEHDPSTLADCGPARPFVGISAWLNTPDNQPLTLRGLRGRVVLVDFWTYSCINCQRTLPYLTAWDDRYRDLGLTIVGVHSPEFAFEHERANVKDQAAALGVHYPIALDNDFRTWRAYDQRYWPAHYLIDRAGTVRQVHYGEGAYAETEELIRQLLAEDGAAAAATPAPYARTDTAGPRSYPLTPETYLGYRRADAYANDHIERDRSGSYQGPTVLGSDLVALDGSWTVESERITAGSDARLRLHASAASVYLVLGGTGIVRVSANGEPATTVTVNGAPTLHTLLDGEPRDVLLTLEVSPGVSAYAFTFG
jgi:cytochrome c biogenesis protein CcdA/thiol-disulfide isomerase/thioredoxin